MTLRSALERILIEFPASKRELLEEHPLAKFVRGDAEASVSDALGETGTGLIVQGSPGQGNWATVPWISVFDPAITTSATRGYYIVYLFHAVHPVVHLSLNQGTTAVREEFGREARTLLADRAEFMRKRVADFAELLPITTIELGSSARLPADYVAGHALGASYNLHSLPDERVLRADLQSAARAYRALTFRGGVEGEVEAMVPELTEEFNAPAQTSVIETRKYAYHRKIERNRTAARYAKRLHGTRCQACNLNFEERYGAIGKGFIEAHHLRPIATLEEGTPVSYDVAADFAVLCANCHRMIHRSDDPSNVGKLKASLLHHH